MKALRWLALAAFVPSVAACGGSHVFSPPGIAPQYGASASPQGLAKPRYVDHVVVIIQENRSFDTLFGSFPGADGATTGKLYDGTTVSLRKHDLWVKYDLDHSIVGFRTGFNHGLMNGFNREIWTGSAGPAGRHPYQYADPAQIRPYWILAQRYVLADRMFQTQGTASFASHIDLIRGDALVSPTDSLIDNPVPPSPQPSPPSLSWGCDSDKGTKTSLLTRDETFLYGKGPFPCLRNYETIHTRLDAAGIPWKYYAPALGTDGTQWSAYDAIADVRYSSEWTKNVSSPETNIFRDVREGRLAAVSWVVPKGSNSDHPRSAADNGPAWVAQVVNAIGKSRYWKHTAIFIVWDDWGGFYDHVAPPRYRAWDQLGFRVPLIVVSPHVPRGRVVHEQYEFGSIIKFVEENWRLQPLGTTDVRANSLAPIFDFSKPARPFRPIPASLPQSFFENQAPDPPPARSDFEGD